MATVDPFINVESVYKSYSSGGRETTVLRGLDLKVGEGETVLIFGPSGSGKSTLLNLLAGLDLPDRGSVIIEGTDLTTLEDAQLTLFRRERIGFIFQFFNLIPSLTAVENVELGIEPVVEPAEQRALTYLERVGLAEKVDRYPSKLSGGEQQRVAIARALGKEPALVLADEPTGNLDQETAEQIVDTIDDIQKMTETTFVIVSHDDVLDRVANRKLWMEHGTLNEKNIS